MQLWLRAHPALFEGDRLNPTNPWSSWDETEAQATEHITVTFTIERTGCGGWECSCPKQNRILRFAPFSAMERFVSNCLYNWGLSQSLTYPRQDWVCGWVLLAFCNVPIAAQAQLEYRDHAAVLRTSAKRRLGACQRVEMLTLPCLGSPNMAFPLSWQRRMLPAFQTREIW